MITGEQNCMVLGDGIPEMVDLPQVSIAMGST